MTAIAAAALAVIAAPVAGVIAVKRTRSMARAAATLTAGVLLYVLASLAVSVAASGSSIVAATVIMQSAAMLGAAALALTALGALAAVAFRDAIDAAGAATAGALILAFGLLASGPAGSDLPTSTIDAALIANPIVATAAAADVDILRGATLYELSPLAHRQFSYPSWPAAFALHTTVAAAGFVAAAAVRRRARSPQLTLLT